MKVTLSFRHAALALPLLASMLFAGMASARVANTAKFSILSAGQMAAQPAFKKDTGTVRTDGSMVAWW